MLTFKTTKKAPGLSRGHPKNYDKNVNYSSLKKRVSTVATIMKTPTNRIRKLLAYLYYTKKAPRHQRLGVLKYLLIYF